MFTKEETRRRPYNYELTINIQNKGQIRLRVTMFIDPHFLSIACTTKLGLNGKCERVNIKASCKCNGGFRDLI